MKTLYRYALAGLLTLGFRCPELVSPTTSGPPMPILQQIYGEHYAENSG